MIRAERVRARGFLACLLLIVAGNLSASETLTYRAELKSVLTLFSWAMVGTITVQSEDSTRCPGGGSCRETEVWMTSETAPSLESLYPLRYLYRTVYRPDRQQTLAFEELRNRRNAADDVYPWRHRMLWLAGRDGSAMRFDFDGKGEAPPPDVAAWVHDDKIGEGNLRVKNSREVPMNLPAVDRLGGLDILRSMELAPGVTWTRAGAGPKGSLTFRVTVEDKETLVTGSRTWEAWRLKVEERRNREGERDPAPLYAWIADDAARTPVRFTMNHIVGSIRLTLE